MSDYIFPPAPVVSIPIIGSDQRFPVNRIFCIGRNYDDHAAEMGTVIERGHPFYFTKSASALVMAEGDIAYATRTSNYHYEMEVVVALDKGGSDIKVEDALSHVYGAAAGVDMTRRDLQNFSKEKRRPWDTSKDVEQSAVVTPLRPMADVPSVSKGRIHLEQNGELRQDSDLSLMAWSIAEIISDLSELYTLQAGDIIYGGTPSGVGPVERGDVITGGIDGIGEFTFTIA